MCNATPKWHLIGISGRSLVMSLQWIKCRTLTLYLHYAFLKMERSWQRVIAVGV